MFARLSDSVTLVIHSLGRVLSGLCDDSSGRLLRSFHTQV